LPAVAACGGGPVIRAVVFDFDGTILETEGPAFQAWSEVWARHGCELRLQEWAAGIGTQDGFRPYEGLRRAVAARGRPFPLAAEGEVREAARARVAELLAAAEPRPGVDRWLAEAAALGLAVGIASSSPAEWVERHLAGLGLRSRFLALSCCDGPVPPKPHPASYRAACRALGVSPAEAVAVEDSPHGVAAARAAGLFCVAVPSPLTAALDLGAADLVVDSLAAVTLAEVVALASASAGPR
jgi:HAD superfamily hydrolase (TIGR01509 family)